MSVPKNQILIEKKTRQKWCMMEESGVEVTAEKVWIATFNVFML